MKLVRWQPKGAVRRWSAFDGFDDIQKELDRAFGWAFGGPWDLESGDSMLTPAVDITEDENQFHVRVDLPGVKKDEIELTVDGDTLTIQGEKKRESEVKNDHYYRLERSFGKFARSLTLPSSVDANKIEATYKDGVLRIMLPKSEEARSRKIKIES